MKGSNPRGSIQDSVIPVGIIHVNLAVQCLSSITENVVQNSAEPPLLTLSKTSGSLFSSQFNVICLDTWRKCRCGASEGVWPLSPPLMDLHFSFSCFPPRDASSPSNFLNFDLRCLAVIWWGAFEAAIEGDWVNIRHWHFSVIWHHRGHIRSRRRGGVRPYPQQQLSQTLRDREPHLKCEMRLPEFLKQAFEVVLSKFCFYPFNEKTHFFPSWMLAACCVNGFTRRSISLWISPLFSVIIMY